MPATLIEDPLGIRCMFSDGTMAELLADGLPCPELARDLLAGLVELVYPHGPLDAARSVAAYVTALRKMVTTLAAGGFAGGAGELTRPQLAKYWLGATASAEGSSRRLVRAFGAATGQLGAAVADLAGGRSFNQWNTRPLPPYSDSEWGALSGTCAGVIGDSYRAHRQALAAVADGADPAVAGWSLNNLRWLLAQSGPSTRAVVSEHAGLRGHVARACAGFAQASTELFPHTEVVIAYRLLFGIHCGVVPDGIDDLVTGDIDWAGDASILLSYVKGRTAAESITLPRRAVRLLEQWLSHSALLRTHVPAGQRQCLWPRVAWEGCDQVATGPPAAATIQSWLRGHQVTGDDGGILMVRRDRIRTTHQAMRDKSAWTGSRRAVIDPNHGPQVEGDHYLSVPTPAQQQLLDTVIADAQHDLLRRAYPPTVLTDADTASLARDYPQLIASLELDDQVIGELAGRQRDVFTAACADQLSGLHGPKGRPCPARPWVCLLCPLAIFAPRHASNLLRLKGFFSRQWQQLPAAQFMAVFGPYASRIDEVLARYDPALLTAASQATADEAQIPLRPEERST
jgi:hypothetical protein